MTFIETSNLAGAALAVKQGATPWTDERILTLSRLWKEGRSATEISVEMGIGTRNAVIGKLSRLGLMKGDRIRRNPIQRAPKAPRISTARIKVKPPLAEPDGYVPGVIPPAANPIYSLFDLQESHCRFPHGEPEQPGFHYCGGKRVDGRPYCGSHLRVAYRPKG